MKIQKKWERKEKAGNYEEKKGGEKRAINQR